MLQNKFDLIWFDNDLVADTGALLGSDEPNSRLPSLYVTVVYNILIWENIVLLSFWEHHCSIIHRISEDSGRLHSPDLLPGFAPGPLGTFVSQTSTNSPRKSWIPAVIRCFGASITNVDGRPVDVLLHTAIRIRVRTAGTIAFCSVMESRDTCLVSRLSRDIHSVPKNSHFVFWS